jgi:hypothetical protein
MAMSIKQANVPSVIFLFSAHSRGGGGGGGVVHGTNFVGGGVRCRATAVVGRMWGQSQLPKNKWRTHSRGRRKEEKKKIRKTE